MNSAGIGPTVRSRKQRLRQHFARAVVKALTLVLVLPIYPFFTAPSANANAAVTSGLVLDLNGSLPGSSNGTSYNGSTWFDQSGNSRNATAINSPTYNSSDGSFTFNGTNQYFNLGNILPFTSAFSIEVTFTPSAVTGWSGLVSRQNAVVAGNYFMAIANSKASYYVESSPYGISSTSNLSAGTKYTATQVWDSTNRDLTPYLNGLQNGTTTRHDWSLAGNNIDLLIGASLYENVASGFFSGKIHSVRIYNRALSSSEVLQSYNAIPTVSSVTSNAANGTYRAGDVIDVRVTFSEAVTVTGTPQITLETGSTDRTVTYSSGSGSTVLVFNYTVQAGDTASDLDYVAANSLALNGGSIRDANGNIATLTLPTPGATNSLGNSKAIIIDTACSPTSQTLGGFTTVTFTSTTVCNWSIPAGITAADVLVVGGGGGGGAGGYNRNAPTTTRGGGGGGGGGGGQVVTQTLTGLSADSFTISVGAGGAGATTGGRSGSSWGGTNGRDGSSSSITRSGTTTTAAGGGQGIGGGFWALSTPASSACNNSRSFLSDGLTLYYIDGIGGRGGNSGNGNTGGRPLCGGAGDVTTGVGGAGVGGAGNGASTGNLSALSTSLQAGGVGTSSSLSGSSVEYGTGGSGGGGEGGGATPSLVGAAGSRAGMGGNGGAGANSGTASGNDSSIGAVGGAGANGLVIIKYAEPAVSITTPTVGLTGTRGSNYSLTLLRSGGSGSGTFSIVSGSLPAGVTLVGAVISGTPTETGTFEITARITDTNTTVATTSPFSIVIGNPTCVATEVVSGVVTYQAFKTVGSACNWTPPAGVSAIDLLVVAGGGGGGSRHAGGGGAGGLINSTNLAINGGVMSIVVGDGGAGGAARSDGLGNQGTNGSNSSVSGSGISALTAIGGGGGTYGSTGSVGGSGGGGGCCGQAAGNGTAGQGNAGSAGFVSNPYYLAGGGGGAGTTGVAATGASTYRAGLGGTGAAVAWIPTSVRSTLGVGVESSSSVFFAGGGGGGTGLNGTGGTGGTGGGGGGATAGATSTAGTANTGGGGGGAGLQSDNTTVAGGKGGSGVVVLRYLTAAPTISSQPSSATVVSGNAAALSVTTGSTPTEVTRAFQWQSSADGTTYSNISGATSASYSPTVTFAKDNGKRFRVVVTDTANNSTLATSTTSTAATLTVTQTFTITYAAGAVGVTGSGPGAPLSVSFGATFTTPANSYTRTGFTFTGWSDGTATYAAGVTYPSSGSVAGDVTLTATWGSVSTTFTPSSGPAITTSAFEGRAVTAVITNIPSGGSPAYQWFGGSDANSLTAISGATSITYTPKASDRSLSTQKYLSVRVIANTYTFNSPAIPVYTYPNATGGSVTAPSPAAVGTYTSGRYKVGQTVIGHPWQVMGTPWPTLNYQWYVCNAAAAAANVVSALAASPATCAAATGAGNSGTATRGGGANAYDLPGHRFSYVVPTEAAGKFLTFTATLSNEATTAQGSVFTFTQSRTQNSGIIQTTPGITGTPTISGILRVTRTLTATSVTATTVNDNPTGKISYQWQRCTTNIGGCSDITGATRTTYKIVSADQSKYLRVVATARNNATTPDSTSVTSAITGVITS